MLYTLLSLPVAVFIKSRSEAFGKDGRCIDDTQRQRLSAFFAPALLEDVRIVTGRTVSDPAIANFARKIRVVHLPRFEHVAAVTFSNVVVFHEAVTTPVLFHELVHVAQYRQLGVSRFSKLYVAGFLRTRMYESIPLESHAFELERRFERNPNQPFNVEEEVSRAIRDGAYEKKTPPGRG